METKKHTLAEKKITGALSTFTSAVVEIEKAITLKQQSVEADKVRYSQMEQQIKSIENGMDEVQANIIKKQGEIKSHNELAEKLKEFTGGN